MAFKFTYSKTFEKHYKKLSSAEQKLTKRKLRLLSEDPTHPSLRTKKIKGIDGVWETSVNMDIRVLWLYDKDEWIFLLDVGHHDLLDRY